MFQAQSRRLALVVLAAALVSPLSGCADAATTVDPTDGCKDPAAIARADLVQVSVDTLRKYYGTDSGFEGGQLFFQEIVVEPDRKCVFEDTYVAYRVDLPEALRPRPHDDQVAVAWGFDGTLNIFVLNTDNDSVYVEGQNPLSAIIHFKAGTAQADINAYLAQLQKDHPNANFMPLGRGPGGQSAAISLAFGRSLRGYEDPALVQAALAIQQGANARGDVEFVNLESYGFWKTSFRGPVVPLDGELLHLECHREFTADRSIQTLTSLPIPMGLGRHYNLTECPLEGWPDECEYAESKECKEAMANL